jgi:hypothetical protein
LDRTVMGLPPTREELGFEEPGELRRGQGRRAATRRGESGGGKRSRDTRRWGKCVT